MTLEQDLRTALWRESESCPVRDLDLPALLKQGHVGLRRRARRRWLTAAAVVAVLCLGAAATSLFPRADSGSVDRPTQDLDSRPATVFDLTQGAPPAIPYCSNGTQIRGAGAPIASRCLTMEHRGGSTIGFDERGVFWIEDGQIRLLDGRGWVSWLPAVSHDGRYAAWVNDDRGWGNLLIYDLASHRSVTEARLPRSQVWVPGIDDLHRVYLVGFEPPARIWMYDIPNDRLTRLRNIPTLDGAGVTYVTADGLGLRAGFFYETGEVTSESMEGAVTADGRFVPRTVVPHGWTAYSPDRSLLLHETREGFWVQPSSDLTRKTVLQLPASGRATALPVWETANTVLVSFDPTADAGWTAQDPSEGFDVPARRVWLLRCSAKSGDCEVALGPGNAGRMVGTPYR